MLWAWASLLIRSGLILGAAELLRRWPRNSAAAYRHRIVIAGFALLLMWPLFSAVMPPIHLSLWMQSSSVGTVTVQQTIASLGRALPNYRLANWPLVIWGVGVLLSLLPVVAGYASVRRLVRHASRLDDECWQELMEQESARAGLRTRPELMIAPGEAVPFTFGLRRARIVLPSSCVDWTELRRRAVLIHELAHIRRRDLHWQLFGNFVAALWWFQPLSWASRWSLRRESERACDATVLQSGIRPSDYAGELLEIARLFSRGQRWGSAAIAMAQRGELEGRLYAILAAQPNGGWKRPVGAITALSVLTVAASAVTIFPDELRGGHAMKRTLISGLLTSAGLSAASITGSVFDPSGAAVSHAQASLYNPDTSAKQEAATTSDGKFAFGSLPAGSYILHVEKPGFASLYREFNVREDSAVERGLVLNNAPRRGEGRAEIENTRVVEAQPSTPKVVRIDGETQEAKLTRKVQPVYPGTAKAAHIQGTVKLDMTISKEGVPEDIRVVSSPSDDLTQSALDAVRQWRYSPTLLNGDPVAVVTNVVVNYTLSE
jgi:TonB family protein